MITGKLDQVLVLQQPSETNVGGGSIITWSDVAIVWGQVISEKGQEAFQSARVQASEKIRVQMRYRSDVSTTWRLTWLGQSYSVINIDRSMKRKGELWATCALRGAV